MGKGDLPDIPNHEPENLWLTNIPNHEPENLWLTNYKYYIVVIVGFKILQLQIVQSVRVRWRIFLKFFLNIQEDVANELESRHGIPRPTIALFSAPTTSSRQSREGNTAEKYFLQKWCSKWKEYVDVENKRDVKEGDKLTVVKICSNPPPDDPDMLASVSVLTEVHGINSSVNFSHMYKNSVQLCTVLIYPPTQMPI